MTLDEYLEKREAAPKANFNVRTVDTSGFKGMVAKGKEKGEKREKIGFAEKPKKAPVAKKEDKKEEKIQLDVGFRMVCRFVSS
jgi:hypothetical protein